MFVCISEEQFTIFCAHFFRAIPSAKYWDRDGELTVIKSFDTTWGQVDIWLN